MRRCRTKSANGSGLNGRPDDELRAVFVSEVPAIPAAAKLYQFLVGFRNRALVCRRPDARRQSRRAKRGRARHGTVAADVCCWRAKRKSRRHHAMSQFDPIPKVAVASTFRPDVQAPATKLSPACAIQRLSIDWISSRPRWPSNEVKPRHPHTNTQVRLLPIKRHH